MHSPSSPTGFRPDIEGLRALAILLVVASHVGVPGVTGGFVGVDVFFVISGYLITRQLQAEWIAHGQIDVMGFYARRMRRLLPAMGLLLIATIAAIWLVYSPIEQPRVLMSAFAASLYISNLHFISQATDYMAPAAKLDPLLHTWSLGVEEQFYLTWPLLLIMVNLLARRYARPRLTPALLAVIGLSSLAACVGLSATQQSLAFFLPLTRAWEFCLGAMVALGVGRATGQAASASWTRLQHSLAMAGMLAILASALAYSELTVFPGSLALVPALGTAVLITILPRVPNGGYIGQALASPPLQWLGKRSYSWYLWHWPTLVIGRVVLPQAGLLPDLALALASLLLAQLSFHLVEEPARTSPFLRHKAAVLALTVAVVTGSVLLIDHTSTRALAEAETERFQRLLAISGDMPALYQQGCDRSFEQTDLVECTGGAAGAIPTIVLIGDSHAGQWASAVDQIARDAGWRLILMTKSACPVVDQDFVYPRLGRRYFECRTWREAAILRIQAIRPQLVVISNSENYPFSPAEWLTGTKRAVAAIASHTQGVVLLRDTPSPGFNAAHCLARQAWNGAGRPCSFDASKALSPQVIQAYRTVASQHPNTHVIDMTPYICASPSCSVTVGKIIKYRDGNHLSDTFARTLSPGLKSSLQAVGIIPRRLAKESREP